MHRQNVMSTLTSILFFVLLAAGIAALVWFVVLPGKDLYDMDRLMRAIEDEGVEEDKFPAMEVRLPGPAAEGLVKYGRRAIPYFLPLLDHKRYRVRAKAWDGLQKVADMSNFGYAPNLNEVFLAEEAQKIKDWWEKEKEKEKEKDRPQDP
jgi:hypothetical protein